MTMTTHPTPASRTTRDVLPLLIAGLWGAGAFALARTGAFVDADGGPPLRLMLAVVVPVTLFLVAWRILPAVAAWVRDLDPALVTGLQTFRVLGIVFVFLFFLGELPLVFAFAAGLGDVAVGILALLATLSVARGQTGSARLARALVIFGTLDFLLAFGTATLSGIGGPLLLAGEEPVALMQVPPMAMIPIFGVPLFLILHVISWIKLGEARARAGS